MSRNGYGGPECERSAYASCAVGLTGLINVGDKRVATLTLAYADESGSAGAAGSTTFTLGCVLVEAARWPNVFDDVLDYRRFLPDRFGLPVRAEIKANYLLRTGGPFRYISGAFRNSCVTDRGYHASPRLNLFGVLLVRGGGSVNAR